MPARCPCCGAARASAGTADGTRAGQALEALYREVALIRQLAEAQAAANQSDEIRLLRETIARLRGTSATQIAVAAATSPRPPAPARPVAEPAAAPAKRPLPAPAVPSLPAANAHTARPGSAHATRPAGAHAAQSPGTTAARQR